MGQAHTFVLTAWLCRKVNAPDHRDRHPTVAPALSVAIRIPSLSALATGHATTTLCRFASTDWNPVSTPSFMSFRDVGVQFARLQPELARLSQMITTMRAVLEAAAADGVFEDSYAVPATSSSDATAPPLSIGHSNTFAIPPWLASGEFAQGM